MDFSIQFIGLHRIADSLKAIMNMILFNITLACSTNIACNLYVLELNAAINVEAIAAFLNMFVILGLTFGYYYFAERITQDLLSIGDAFYGSAWYRLEGKNQKLLMLPIMRAQRVFRLSGLGIFYCSLSVFSKVRCFFCISTDFEAGQLYYNGELLLAFSKNFE